MLGFIGTGNMGGAILTGVLGAGIASPEDIIFTRTNPDAGRAQAEQTGARFVTSSEEVYSALREGDTLIVAVKPRAMAGVLSTLGPHRGPVIVSVAAGISLATLAQHAPQGAPIVRVMPNVNSQIGAGMSGLCPNDVVTADQLTTVQAIFAAVGRTALIAEKDFPAFSAIAGCSPAWTCTYIDALARGALAAGMTIGEARTIAAQAVLGSAQLLLDASFSPSDLRDQVTSPGGTTVAGLIALEDGGFSPAVVGAVKAAIERDREMGTA